LWAVRDTAIVEDKAKPVVLAVTQQFADLGTRVAEVEGHSNMRQLVFPYPLEGLPEKEIRELAREYFPRFLEVIGAER